jgi:hypothetical protein
VRRGIALWREAGAPYETARARLLLGETFESLGAALDLQRATQLLGSGIDNLGLA